MPEWTLITGASEGLGVEFAKIAARHGRNMILTARSKDKLEALAMDLRADGPEVVVIPADLNDPDDADRMWAEATKDRQIDFVINNAGLGRNGGFAEDDGWNRELTSINVNVVALTKLMKLAVPHMLAAGSGRILNVASVAAFMPGPNMAVYHATKAYVLSLSEAVAHELRNTRVTVTTLCPGPTATNFFDDAGMNGVRLIKMSPPAKAHDVAAAGWQGALGGQRVVVPGVTNKASALFGRILPRGLSAAVAHVFLSRS